MIFGGHPKLCYQNKLGTKQMVRSFSIVPGRPIYSDEVLDVQRGGGAQSCSILVPERGKYSNQPFLRSKDLKGQFHRPHENVHLLENSNSSSLKAGFKN